MDEIIDSMVRTLWVLAWSEAMEEADRGGELSGMELMDLAPPLPDEYQDEFNRLGGWLYGRIMQAAGHDPFIVLANWYVDTGTPEFDEVLREWGHYAIMEAAGHGVAWSDAWPRVGYVQGWDMKRIELPYVRELGIGIETPIIELPGEEEE